MLYHVIEGGGVRVGAVCILLLSMSFGSLACESLCINCVYLAL